MPLDPLNEGIAAAQEGNRELARKLLSQAVRVDPDSSLAWLWLGRVLDDPEKKRYCFERVMILSFGSTDAVQELHEQKPPSDKTDPFIIAPKRPAPPPQTIETGEIPLPDPDEPVIDPYDAGTYKPPSGSLAPRPKLVRPHTRIPEARPKQYDVEPNIAPPPPRSGPLDPNIAERRRRTDELRPNIVNPPEEPQDQPVKPNIVEWQPKEERSEPNIIERYSQEEQAKPGLVEGQPGEERPEPNIVQPEPEDETAVAPNIAPWEPKVDRPEPNIASRYIPPEKVFIEEEIPEAPKPAEASPFEEEIPPESEPFTAQIAQVPAAKPALSQSESIKALVVTALIGMIIGLLLIGGPSLFLILSGKFDSYIIIPAVLPATPTPQALTATLTPGLTFTPVWTATIPATPVVAATLGYDQRFQAEANDISQALLRMKQTRFAEAIPYWDLVIARVPEDADASYQRAICYHELSRNVRSQKEFTDYIHLALADIDRAIASGPALGDYFHERYSIYWDMSGIEPSRASRDQVLEIALENIQTAIGMNTSDNQWHQEQISTLNELGHCDQGLAQAQRLLNSLSTTSSDAAGLNLAASTSYFCLGSYQTASQSLSSALARGDTPDLEWQKALVLYGLDQQNQALDTVNQLIRKNPASGGYRYYYRALLYYELKRPNLAINDLASGSSLTWSRDGLYAYVKGKLALDSGDSQNGIALLQQAETTLSRSYGPILALIQKDLADLNASPLASTPDPSIAATPITAAASQPTPRPTLTGKTVSERIPPGSISVIDLNAGTGKLLLRAGDYPLFRFQPPAAIPVQSVQKLIFRIQSSQTQGAVPLELYLWSSGIGWKMITPLWGDNTLDTPGLFVSSEGDIYAALRNTSGQSVDIIDLGFILTVQKTDGTIQTYGLK